ncbi:carboxymuconolactone decarboxylase family protein [Streptomyces sp. NPDC002643]
MTARLAGFLPGDMSVEQTAVYEAICGGPRAASPQAFALTDAEGRLRGPFNAMLLSPPVGAALQAVGSAVRYQSSLSARVREMAILLVAARWDSAFERTAHEAVGRACGLTEEELGHLRSCILPTLTDRDETVALRTVAALLRSGALSDDEYHMAVAAIGESGLFELTTLVGYYSTLALQLRVFAGEGGASKTSAAALRDGAQAWD